MTIDHKFDKDIEEHFDSIRSLLKESNMGIWDVIEEYMQSNPNLKEELKENNTNIIEAGHYFLGRSSYPKGLIREAHQIVYSEMFDQVQQSNSKDSNSYNKS
ncbi:MAG: hypothetical protein WDZ62_02375 [Candidatus Pacearchaeota archaeon]